MQLLCAARAEEPFEVGFVAHDQQALKKFVRRGLAIRPSFQPRQAPIAHHLAKVCHRDLPISVVHIVLCVVNTVCAPKSNEPLSSITHSHGL
jgi:hypothetical protein